MLWAGTTFQLQATASMGNQLAAISDGAQVRVGQVVRWKWQVESPAGQSVVSGVNSEAIFRVRVINDGNGWDQLGVHFAALETVETPTWTVELRESATGAWQSSSALTNGLGSPIEPGSDIFYLMRMRPPGSSIPTDGAWAQMRATTSDASLDAVLGEFVAGVVRPAHVPTRAWCWREHTQFVAPILYDGRLIWMGTDPNTNNTVVFHTRDALHATTGGTLGNERLTGRILRGFRPTGFSVALGNNWFVGSGNQLVRLDIAEALNATATTPVVFPVEFPSGVAPRLDVEPVVFNRRLYVAGNDGRLYAFREDGQRLGNSAAIPARYGAISTNIALIGRLFYVGTQEGWLVRIDALTGSLRTARRLATQPLHSLAPTALGRALVVRAGNRTVLGVNPNQMSVLWRRTINEDIVSPVSASPHQEVAAFLTQSGVLHAIHTRMGVSLGHYPQSIFGNQAVVRRATIGFARREDRKTTYVYVLAQRETGDENLHQGLFRAVTLENPYNRLEFGESTLHLGSEYLPVMGFTGNSVRDYCLIASRRADTNGGTVAAIPLR
ncbi:MAG: PQQ-binding-like beta-propeller repeat protein [Fimbriimonadales bacterium]